MFSGDFTSTDSSAIVAVFDADELAFELGLWLSGLESFLSTSGYSFAETNRAKDAARDWTKECRLTHSALLLCAKLNFRLRKTIGSELGDEQDGLTLADLDDFTLVLRDAIVLNESIIKGEPLKFGDWRSWNSILLEKITASSVFDKLTGMIDRPGEEYLPETLQKLLQSKQIPFADEADLSIVIPRFAKILRWLSVVERMLRNDEPLKPSLLIFSKVFEQTEDLINHINNRLSRFPNEEAELFGSLDSASYTAAVELKKVFNQELTGLVGLRPAPTIYARIETAYSLLNDSFQQILAGFARVIDPKVLPSDIFPAFQTKLEKSLVLRERLWKVSQVVQAAEQKPEKQLLEALNGDLKNFLAETLGLLYSKDKETVERFCEEIMATSERKDLVPVLHRFGAYLETLFSQVNMRTVLAAHPFEAATKI
jgi:hypothetical protein